MDCLGWLDYQLSRPTWLTLPDHPVHTFGLSTLKESVAAWRACEHPSSEQCDALQQALEAALTSADWGRLRKSLYARKRRRRQHDRVDKAVTISLTPAAHQALVELRDLAQAETFSDAIEHSLQSTITELRQQKESSLQEELKALFKPIPASKFVALVEAYLSYAQEKRSLANSCKIAHQLFKKRPERDTLKLVRDRLLEDLVWNETHLNIPFRQLKPFANVPLPNPS